MRYVSAILYALAAAHGAGIMRDAVGTGACVFAGTVAFAFAVEGIVKAEGRWRR